VAVGPTLARNFARAHENPEDPEDAVREVVLGTASVVAATPKEARSLAVRDPLRVRPVLATFSVRDSRREQRPSAAPSSCW
jgi:hypothetical protein